MKIRILSIIPATIWMRYSLNYRRSVRLITCTSSHCQTDGARFVTYHYSISPLYCRPRFAKAVQHFVDREHQGIGAYVNELEEHSPLKSTKARSWIQATITPKLLRKTVHILFPLKKMILTLLVLESVQHSTMMFVRAVGEPLVKSVIGYFSDEEKNFGMEAYPRRRHYKSLSATSQRK